MKTPPGKKPPSGKQATPTPKAPAERPASFEDDEANNERHSITLPLTLSLRLMQAVSDERLRRKKAQIPGRVTDSTVVRKLLDQYLPPLRDSST